MKYPFGYKEGDGLLNDCGVCTTYSEVETIQLMDGWKKGRDHARLEIVTTPDGHYLIGLDVAVGSGGWGFAPSISGTGYETRLEAIGAAVKLLLGKGNIEAGCKKVIQDTYDRLRDEAEQPTLF